MNLPNQISQTRNTYNHYFTENTITVSMHFRIGDYINIQDNLPILITAVLSAFLGAYFGRKLLKKVTLDFVQWTVAIMILVLSVLLGMGII